MLFLFPRLCAVWDSSIVLAKLFERWPEQVAGARCLDLSAGCGLVGLALSKLGAAEVVATDLEPNLPLLRKNYEANGEPAGCPWVMAGVDWFFGWLSVAQRGSAGSRHARMPLPKRLMLSCGTSRRHHCP